MIRLEHLDRRNLSRLISEKVSYKLPPSDLKSFNKCISFTMFGSALFDEDKLICICGLAPPTVLSDQAYLWFHTVEPLEGYEFMVIRNSQRTVEEALKTYPMIIGHCLVGATQSIRWMRLLGAKFSEPQGKVIPFTIQRRKDG